MFSFCASSHKWSELVLYQPKTRTVTPSFNELKNTCEKPADRHFSSSFFQRLHQHCQTPHWQDNPVDSPSPIISSFLPVSHTFFSILSTSRASKQQSLTNTRLSSDVCSLWLFNRLLQFCANAQKGVLPTDSLDWSRKFDILSISRLTLQASGIPYDLVASLTDEDMQTIADKAQELVISEPIEKVVEFVARLYLAEKGAVRHETTH